MTPCAVCGTVHALLSANQWEGWACVWCGELPANLTVPTGCWADHGQLFRCAPGHGCQA